MISVVIPVKNRSQDLQRCIRSIVESHAYLENMKNICELQILVIDDHSEENLYQAMEEFPSVLVMENDGVGPGSARNLGMRESKFKIVGFIDSDCVADKRWLLRIFEQLESGHVLAVQGNPCLFMKEQNPRIGRCEEKLYLGLFKTYIDGGYSTQVDTRNCAFHKNIIDAYDGEIFITDMKKAQAEARVCGNNLVKKGIRIHYDDEMLVYHKDPSSIITSMKQKVRHGSGRIYVWDRTPSLSYLIKRYFWNPVVRYHLPAWYIVPVHAAFLWGYIKSRVVVCDRPIRFFPKLLSVNSEMTTSLINTSRIVKAVAKVNNK